MQQKAAFRARWVIPVTSPPIENGLVTIDKGKIVTVIADAPTQDGERDLGNCVLIPGLVNAHCHLEFSNLESPLGFPGIEFTEWIKLVVSERMSAHESTSKSEAIAKGLRESFLAGVGHVGEIATHPVIAADYQSDSNTRTTVFHELLGRNDEQLCEKLVQLEQASDSFDESPNQFGVSPHAPYSVSPLLFASLLKQATAKSLPVAMHLAESREELQLMRDGEGPFVDLLKSFNAWFPETYQSGHKPLNYLHSLAKLPRAIVVHGNYLDEEELDFLAKTELSVAYCPRTHKFFKHSQHPLQELLDRNVNVSLGTDSRASNPDLDLFGEMKSVRDSFPSIPAETILRMATLGGAIALGVEAQIGSIEPGKHSNLAVASISKGYETDPFSSVMCASHMHPLSEFISSSEV